MANLLFDRPRRTSHSKNQKKSEVKKTKNKMNTQNTPQMQCKRTDERGIEHALSRSRPITRTLTLKPQLLCRPLATG